MRTFPVALIVLAGLVCLPEHGWASPHNADQNIRLPAWETAAERLTTGKADKYDDYREANQQWYAVTAPPVVAVRPLSEYEPSRAVLMRPSGSISAFHKGIIKAVEGHVQRLVIFHTPGQMEKMADKIDSWGVDPGFIQFLDVADSNSIWTRDYGPVSHVSPNGHVGFTDFRYYKQRHFDDAISSKLAADWDVNVFRVSMSFEGGNFMADPHGTCFVTEKIYQQNAGYPQAVIDGWMEAYLGCTQMVAVKRPKKLGTGHIDMFAKLMSDKTMLLGQYDPELQPENAQILDDIESALKAIVTEGGEKLEIHRIPLPWDESGVWYTYTNALIVNDTVLVPVYSDFKDLEAQALEVYETASPELEAQTINSDAIIPSGGAIHCVTMTVPQGVLAPYQDPPPWLCPYNELSKCADSGPCGGLPLEGECGDGKLSYCGEDGYVHQQLCQSCCGWDAEQLWFDCLALEECAECIEECHGDSVGCSLTGGHAWNCGQTDDDPCADRTFAPCADDETCDAESGACTSPGTPCPEGEPCALSCAGPDGCDSQAARICSQDQLDVLLCAQVEQGCLAWTRAHSCPAELPCFDGVCGVPAGQDEGDAWPVVESEEPGPADPDNPNCGCRTWSDPGSHLGCSLLLCLLAALWLVQRRCRVPLDIPRQSHNLTL